MKKLMIAAAIVCAAAFAQAASVSWTTGYFNGSNGQMAYMNELSGYTYSVMVEFSNGITDSGIETYGSFAGEPSGFALNTDYMATIVVTETDGSGNVKTATATGIFTSGDSESFAKTIDFNTGDGFKSGSFLATAEWQSVPEPTSGLLLLIGVAGLALRRRRA